MMIMVGAPPGANPGKYPTLGFDPAPGKPTVVDTTAKKITNVANDLSELRDALKRAAVVDGTWEGVAAQAFARVAEPLPRQLDEIAQALNKASGLFTGWEGSLDDYQRRAVELEHHAAAAKQKLEEARSDPALDLAGQYFPDEESLRQAEARYNEAVQDVRTWEGRLEEIIDQAKRLLETHQNDADRVARQITEITEGVPGLLDMFGDSLDTLGDFAGEVWDWVQEHAEFIKNIGDAFGAMSTALGAAALAAGAGGLVFPPAAPAAIILGIASTAASGVALGAHSVAIAAGQDVDWETIAVDAVGFASLGVGKVASSVGTTSAELARRGYDVSVVGDGAAGPGGVGGVVDDLRKYWLPDDPGESALAAFPVPGPGVGYPALAVWNAWEEAQGTNS
ncbi:MAG: hypothetical protein GEV03_00250 [Streptosporangiales bacterium]|nr:hypothetical protein [Streptosporangiales bacterium]